jgi:hypothetical protein
MRQSHQPTDRRAAPPPGAEPRPGGLSAHAPAHRRQDRSPQRETGMHTPAASERRQDMRIQQRISGGAWRG